MRAHGHQLGIRETKRNEEFLCARKRKCDRVGVPCVLSIIGQHFNATTALISVSRDGKWLVCVRQREVADVCAMIVYVSDGERGYVLYLGRARHHSIICASRLSSYLISLLPSLPPLLPALSPSTLCHISSVSNSAEPHHPLCFSLSSPLAFFCQTPSRSVRLIPFCSSSFFPLLHYPFLFPTAR